MSRLSVLQDLKFHHRDPFDRLLISQAMALGCPLLSANPYSAPNRLFRLVSARSRRVRQGPRYAHALGPHRENGTVVEVGLIALDQLRHQRDALIGRDIGQADDPCMRLAAVEDQKPEVAVDRDEYTPLMYRPSQ